MGDISVSRSIECFVANGPLVNGFYIARESYACVEVVRDVLVQVQIHRELTNHFVLRGVGKGRCVMGRYGGVRLWGAEMSGGVVAM